MKKTSNYKAIVGIKDKGSATEVKNLASEELSKGKATKFDLNTLINSILDIKTACTLAHAIVQY